MLRRYSIILSFVLATLLSVGGVELFYKSLSQTLTGSKEVVQQKAGNTTATVLKKAAGADTAAHSQPKKTGVRQQKKDYTIITKRNLFGKVEVKPPPKKVPPIQKPKPPAAVPTSLDLVLLGTIGGETNDQRAIIRDKKKGAQDIYYTGDTIKHAFIKEILRGKVILDVLGVDEVLLMEETKSPKGSAKGRKNNKPETYSLADVMKEEEKPKTPTRRKSSAKKDKTLQLEKKLGN
jgi:type II secretory pathway component PulC